MSALHVRLAIDSCEVELIDAPAFAAIVVMMSVPFRYSGPARIMLDPTVTEPLTSRDGALTAQENTALLAEIPSRSTPPESARLRVVVAGFTREQVSSLSCSVDDDVSNPFFESRAACSPVTSAITLGPLDDCAAPSACKMFVDPTISCPSIVQFPLAPSAPLT